MPAKSAKQRILEEAERRIEIAERELAHARFVKEGIEARGSGPLPVWVKLAGERWGIR